MELFYNVVYENSVDLYKLTRIDRGLHGTILTLKYIGASSDKHPTIVAPKIWFDILWNQTTRWTDAMYIPVTEGDLCVSNDT